MDREDHKGPIFDTIDIKLFIDEAEMNGMFKYPTFASAATLQSNTLNMTWLNNDGG